MPKGRDELNLTPEQIAAPGAMNLLMIYDELLLVSSRVGLAKYFLPFILVITALIFYANGFQYDYTATTGFRTYFSWQMLPFYLIADAIAIAIWLWDLRYLRRYRLGLPKRLRRAGLVERLAAGPGMLPDIFAYTSFPWRLFLGARPKDFKHTVRLLVWNLDWYLLPEPRPYFRFSWLYALAYCAWAIMQLGFAIVQFAGGPSVTSMSAEVFGTDVQCCSFTLFWLAIGLLLGHEALRLNACARTLLNEVELRLTGPDGAPEEVRTITT